MVPTKITILLKIDGEVKLKNGKFGSEKLAAVPLICPITFEFKYPYARKPAAIPTVYAIPHLANQLILGIRLKSIMIPNANGTR